MNPRSNAAVVAPGPATADVPVATPAAAAERPVASPRRWLVFAVVGLALLMVSLDQTAVATALPAIQNDLGTTLAWSSWTITVFALGNILAMPIAGRLSDQFGRRTVFLVAITVFTLASLGAGMAGNISVLILVRVVQGMACGALMPAATGIVADHFGPDRDRAVGMFTSIFPIGAIIGPVVGGILVTYTGWRAIFLVNLPVGVLVTVLALVVVRHTRGEAGGRVDVLGAGLLCATLLAAMLAITLLASPGPGVLRYGVAAAAAVLAAALGWSVFRHAHVPGAIVPIRLLRGRAFGAMNAVNVLFGAAAIGFGALVPLYAEHRYGILPVAAGGLLAMRAVGMIVTSSGTVLLLRRAGHRLLMLVGFGIVAAGMLLLAVPPPGVSAQLWLMVAAGVTGLGMGIAAPASNNAALHLAPGEVSSIAGLRGMFRQIGAIASISVTTAIVSASADPGIAQAWAFVVFAGLLLAALPLVVAIPDHRGSW